MDRGGWLFSPNQGQQRNQRWNNPGGQDHFAEITPHEDLVLKRSEYCQVAVGCDGTDACHAGDERRGEEITVHGRARHRQVERNQNSARDGVRRGQGNYQRIARLAQTPTTHNERTNGAIRQHYQHGQDREWDCRRLHFCSHSSAIPSRYAFDRENLDGINLTCWPSIPNLVSNYHDPNFHLIWFAGAPARNNNRTRFECWPVPSSITNENPAPYFNKNDTIRSLPRSTNESVLGSFSTQP